MKISRQTSMRVHLVAGARPNFVKIAPLWKALADEEWCEPVIVNTGQHYDVALSDWMFRDLGLPAPHHHLGALIGSHARVTGSVMMAYEKLCLEVDQPDWVVVVGDVDSTVACSLSAKKLGYSVAHLEAGLRSFDRSMPEELNRIVTDSIADLLWTPSPDADENLIREGVSPEQIERVGNIMIDALVSVQPDVDRTDLKTHMGFVPTDTYGVVTLHRPTNVDDPAMLMKLVGHLCAIAQKVDLVFPVHPRTAKAFEQSGLTAQLERARVKLVPPLSYIPFIALMKRAAFLLTDSGGIQEEASYLGVPCLTLRNSTERPITITLGTNRLVRIEDVPAALEDALHMLKSPATIPLWDGKTAGRVVASLHSVGA